MPTYSPNPEYADLPFAWPRAYGKSRDGRGWNQPLPRLLVVHHTAGAEHAQAAEGGAGYDQVRLDGTSAHYYVDPDSIVQCVPTWMRSNTAFYNGNTLGIHYELCGTLQTREQWLDGNSRQIIRRAAAQMRRDAAKYGIPIRRLTVAEVRAGAKGICGHVDITYAFPADGGTHTDPGPHFPWDVLLADIEGDAVTQPFDPYQDPTLRTMAQRVDAIRGMDPEYDVAYDNDTATPPVRETNELAAELNRHGAQLAELLARRPVTSAPVDLPSLVAALRPAIAEECEKAVRKVLGGVDGASP